MGPDHDINFSVFQTFQRFRFLFRGSEAVHVGNIHGKVLQSFFKTPVVLKCQNRCWDQNRNLFPVRCSFESSSHRNFCFTKTYVATDQTIHHGIVFHVFFYVDGCFFLIGSVFVNKTCFKFILEISIGSECETFCCFSLCIQSYQVESDLLYLCFCFLF